VIGCRVGNVKEQQNVIIKFVLDTVIVLVGKVERRPRETWSTQKMIKMSDGSARMLTK